MVDSMDDRPLHPPAARNVPRRSPAREPIADGPRGLLAPPPRGLEELDQRGDLNSSLLRPRLEPQKTQALTEARSVERSTFGACLVSTLVARTTLSSWNSKVPAWNLVELLGDAFRHILRSVVGNLSAELRLVLPDAGNQSLDRAALRSLERAEQSSSPSGRPCSLLVARSRIWRPSRRGRPGPLPRAEGRRRAIGRTTWARRLGPAPEETCGSGPRAAPHQLQRAGRGRWARESEGWRRATPRGPNEQPMCRGRTSSGGVWMRPSRHICGLWEVLGRL